MQGEGAAQRDDVDPAPAPAAAPITFAGCAGFIHPARGEVGVVMCSPWGYEELCARKSWRVLAETLAAAGYPCLRFDYPGCGDSLDPDQLRLKDWIASINDAARVLQETAGVSRLVLLGQGLGGALAACALGEISGAEGLVLLAPAAKGRTWLRELAGWEAMIAGANGYARPEVEPGAAAIAGFELSSALSEDIRRLELAQVRLRPGLKALVLGRAGHRQDEAAAAHLASQGAQVTTGAYLGHEALLTDPTQALIPADAFAEVAGWLAANFPDQASTQAVRFPAAALLVGDGFSETPVTFGGPARLHGVICRPQRQRAQDAVLMLNGGYDHHIGWARMAVDHARELARNGVASLRIDGANIGDSPPRPGLAGQVLYGEAQVDDVSAALDWLEGEGLGPVTVLGRCSGAYLALVSAVRDSRISQVVMVNPLRLVWDPEESVDEAIRFRSFSHYKAKAFKAHTLKRILAGQVDLGRLARRLAQQGWETAAGSLFGGARGKAAALQAEVERRFGVLRDRDVPVSIAFSDSEDEGVERFARHFGKDGRCLADYPNVRLSMIEGADHNLTPRPARDWLLAHVLERVAATAKAQSAAA